MTSIAGPVGRIRAGSVAGLGVVVLTTGLNLVGRRRRILSRAMDLREMAPFVDASRHPDRSLAAGVVVHLVSGIAEGGLYGLVVKRYTARSGMEFMAVTWLVTMLVVMPLTGKGKFGLRSGANVPIATFVLHMIFGAAIGEVTKRVRAVSGG